MGIKYNDNMDLIYIAGKYTGKSYSETEDNIEKARKAGIILARLGWGIIIPHMNTAHFDSLGHDELDYDYFMSLSFSILKYCKAIFMLMDWEESKGAKDEFNYIKDKKIKIFYEKEGYPKIIDL